MSYNFKFSFKVDCDFVATIKMGQVKVFTSYKSDVCMFNSQREAPLQSQGRVEAQVYISPTRLCSILWQDARVSDDKMGQHL